MKGSGGVQHRWKISPLISGADAASSLKAGTWVGNWQHSPAGAEAAGWGEAVGEDNEREGGQELCCCSQAGAATSILSCAARSFPPPAVSSVAKPCKETEGELKPPPRQGRGMRRRRREAARLMDRRERQRGRSPSLSLLCPREIRGLASGTSAQQRSFWVPLRGLL